MSQEPNPDWPTFDTQVRVFGSDGKYTAVFSNDVVLPVVEWFDNEGEDCEPDAAVACVAGADGFGWITITLKGGIERMN